MKAVIMLIASLLMGCMTQSRSEVKVDDWESYTAEEREKAMEIGQNFMRNVLYQVDSDLIVDLERENNFFNLYNLFKQKCTFRFNLVPYIGSYPGADYYSYSFDARVYAKNQSTQDVSVIGISSIRLVLVDKDWTFKTHRFKNDLNGDEYRRVLSVQTHLSGLIQNVRDSCL